MRPPTARTGSPTSAWYVAEGEPAPAGMFERDTTVHHTGESAGGKEFAARVSPDWKAGRGPNGGYLAAMLLRAMMGAVEDDSRAPRSLTIHYLRAPEPGPIAITVKVERQGRSLSSLSAQMRQERGTTALALAAFSVPWSGPEVTELPLPDVAPADPAQGSGVMRNFDGPEFLRNLVLQPRLGGAPFAGPEQPMEFGAWIGMREARALDAPALAFFSDALIPAPFMQLPAPAPAPTVDLTIHFRTALPRSAAGDLHELCFARVRAGAMQEGFFEEDSTIWAADGTLLAQSRQLAILMPGGA